jgi:hypothetical protein
MNDRHMTGVFREKASLGQANGSDVDLIVTGTEFYATYETLDGFPVIYDDSLGLFCYARIEKGRFETTGISVTSSPPPNLEKHIVESDEVRMRKIDERRLQMEQRSGATTK